VLLIAAVVLSAGCVRRRMTVRTNPPDAQVYVDNYPIGKSPVSTPFTYYGTREIRLVRDGYETQTTKQRFLPPWYELPGLDFVSENLWPAEVRDERVLDFQMVPQRIVPTDQLIGRGENLRHASQVGYISPMPFAGPGSADAPPRQPPPDPRITSPPRNPLPLPEYVPPPTGTPLAPGTLPPPIRLPAPDGTPSWAP
jgi:hypothetical protein